MSTRSTLQRLIGKEEDVIKLEALRDTGLDIMVNDADLDDFIQSDKEELIIVINDRILTLQS